MAKHNDTLKNGRITSAWFEYSYFIVVAEGVGQQESMEFADVRLIYESSRKSERLIDGLRIHIIQGEEQ